MAALLLPGVQFSKAGVLTLFANRFLEVPASFLAESALLFQSFSALMGVLLSASLLVSACAAPPTPLPLDSDPGQMTSHLSNELTNTSSEDVDNFEFGTKKELDTMVSSY